jgi:hypothetical protein
MLSVLTLCTDLCLRERISLIPEAAVTMAASVLVACTSHAEAIRSVHNTPSFKTHDDHDVPTTGRLQLLTNMTAGTSTAS